MIFISVNDFYEKAASFSVLSRQEEIECALLMKKGDQDARKRLMQSYLPMVASHIKRTASDMQTLGLVIYCQQALEKAVDSFDFFQKQQFPSRQSAFYQILQFYPFTRMV